MNITTMSEHYDAALAKWKHDGGPRPKLRPDNIPTRIDMNWLTHPELAILTAMAEVERAGGSVALTDAVALLAQARGRVADHVEAPVKVEGPYPGCHHPEKCNATGRCPRDPVCFN